MPTYELEINGTLCDGTDMISLDVDVEISMVRPSTPPSGSYEYYDPGEPAEFKVDDIILTGGTKEKPVTLKLTPEQFEAIFPGGAEMMERAIKHAEDNEGDYHD